jgi:hypothetical protein
MLGICNLPTGILEHAASFLAAPSRALFAVSLNDDSLQDSVIAAIEWDTLDFGDIEKDLAAKLTDNDLSALLLRIDAVNTVKRLRLSGCVNITGAGLDPLRGSTTIEQIDLSLVGDHENPRLLDPEPPISCDRVLSILDSIIEMSNECALKYLQFPQVWRKGCGIGYDFPEGSDQFKFQQFLTRYNSMLERRGFSCKKCSGNIVGVGSYQWMCCPSPDKYVEYALQSYTCYECLDQYCNQCTNEEEFSCAIFCFTCKRKYCEGCSKMKYCSSCFQMHCLDCMEFKECSGFDCNQKCCSNCEFETCSSYFCRESFCMACGYGPCGSCDDTFCCYCTSYCNACGDKICIACYFGSNPNGIEVLCQDCQP